MMPLFKCKYCGRLYRGEPGRCTHDDCPGSGGGAGAAIAIKYPYCTGKYKPLPASYLGEGVRVSDDVVAVYAERRYDNFGPYTKLMCARLVGGSTA